MLKTKNKKQKSKFKKIIDRLDSVSFGGSKDKEYLVENLSMLLTSGMTMSAAIDAVAQEVRSRKMKKILSELQDNIESGTTFWKAFAQSGIFKEHTVALVRVGEESGRLSENLKLIAIQESKERSFSSKIRSAMMYPVFVLSLTVIIGAAIAWLILPRLSSVFAQLRLELPTLTRWLIATGDFLGQYGYIVIPAFLVTTVLVIYFIFYFSKTKFIGHAILFSLPGIKRLLAEVELARFGYLLGSLIEAGVPIYQSLDSLHRATFFPNYKKFYGYLKESVEQGESLRKSFLSYKKIRKLFPVPIQQLIFSGEQSGNLSQTLLKINETFEAKTENTTKNLTVILEPILLVIVWAGVVGVALAVILPIYNLIGGLNTDPGQRINQESVSVPREQVIQNVVETQVVIPEIATTTALTVEPELPRLEILSTGLGYLNVRDEPGLDGDLVDQVLSGELYFYTDQRDDWYEIELSDTQVGWVFGQYIKVIEEVIEGEEANEEPEE